MHSQHDMIAHFLAYKRNNSEMALLFLVSANADFNAPSSHFNGDTYILDICNESMIKNKQNYNLKCKDCLESLSITFICALFQQKNIQQG